MNTWPTMPNIFVAQMPIDPNSAPVPPRRAGFSGSSGVGGSTSATGTVIRPTRALRQVRCRRPSARMHSRATSIASMSAGRRARRPQHVLEARHADATTLAVATLRIKSVSRRLTPQRAPARRDGAIDRASPVSTGSSTAPWFAARRFCVRRRARAAKRGDLSVTAARGPAFTASGSANTRRHSKIVEF